MPGIVCLLRMQDLEDENDEFCLECWENNIIPEGKDRSDYYLSDLYSDRDECIKENCLTEEGYDEWLKERKLQRQRSVRSIERG